MNRIERKGQNFIGYEYKELSTDSPLFSLLIDCYQHFGWELDDTVFRSSTGNRVELKRNRRIINKAELTRLQRKFEANIASLEELEKAKTMKATIAALTIGIVGTAFMAGSVFAVTADSPRIILSILLAIPAFIGWLSPYFIYKRITADQIKQLTPVIEETYDTIYLVCEKGAKLLHK
ncbi:hypothetical protein IW510_07995 [Enterococcus sp. BWR-S5]|nr:hypothetical protein [Enterococcus sp. BWR-S5]